jgi:uncharacterized SAM-binding protein YcdF (DUF218 family)
MTTNLPTAVKASPPGTRSIPVASPPVEKALGGLLVRRYRWGLSRAAKFLLTTVVLAIGTTIFFGAYPFLAVTHRVDTDVLVVEGWVHPYAARAALEEFRNHSYRQIFTTGGPVVGNGGYINDYQTAANVGANLLKKEGIPATLIQVVPSHVIGRDRTFSSAVALRDWFREHDLKVGAINILTEGAHARRTRLLFKKALGPDIKVGVISIPSPDFDAKRWWLYSESVEDVVDEGIGYLYAISFFPVEETMAPKKAKRAESE